MAKRPVKVTKKAKPRFMQNKQKSISNLKKATQSELLAIVAKDLASAGYDVSKRGAKTVIATEAKMRKRGIIDLKYGFARSSKRKTTKDGKGWYMVVPIKKKSRDFKPRSSYDSIRKMSKVMGANDTATFKAKGLAEAINKGKEPTIKSLEYKAKSDNITLKKNKSGKRTSYTVLRTVSNKSPQSSWIIGRGKMNSGNTSKTMERDIERTIAWKLKQMGGK